MWQFIRLRILTLIIFISATQGILVVGPKFIRANQDYTVVISNFKLNMSEVGLMLRMEGRSNDDRSVLNLTKSVDVRRNTNKVITFKMPADLSAGTYKLTIAGQRGFGYQKEVTLVYLGKSISGLIQINKPMFKPGDTVKFRVIVLDTELKPPVRVKSVHATIRDPQNKVIRVWPSAKLYVGVFEGDLQIATTPLPGLWKISVQMDGEELVSRTFEVKEYVFDVEVIPCGIPLMEHRGLNLTIAANYHFRKPVKGLATVELYLEGDKLNQQKQVAMYGMRLVELGFVGHFDEHEHEKDVLVKTTFIEHHKNRTVVKESHITVYKYKYRVDLIKDIPYFHPGLPFKCALQFRYHDGTPAKGITGKVIILDIEYEKAVTSDDSGLIKLELSPGNSLQEMVITFESDDGFYFDEKVQDTGIASNAFIKLELKSTLRLNRLVQVQVTCNEPMAFFVYYVMKNGNIIDSGFIRTNEQNKYPLRFIASQKMIPYFKIIVATVKNDRMMFDYLDIDFEEHHNNLRLNLNKQEVKPGQHIELSLSGQQETYVGLVAYNNGLMHDNKNPDLFWKDIMRVYKGIGPNAEKEFDLFYSMGVFVKTLDDIVCNEAHDMSARDGHQMSSAISKTVSYWTGFPESWLWQNVTLGKYGTHKMIETVPDMITSWYLTGFSIHPEYGLSIIKEPVQLTTAQSFYIVENLPYSIKRDEKTLFLFTLFSNLEEEYIVNVTLYNVANQMEFIGRPLEDLSYTKSVLVPPKVGIPVSFLVKARKLGEMTVRIKATINTNQESDALEKVIRVMPESLVEAKMQSQLFYFDTYQNQTFLMHLDFHKKADNGSKKIAFRLNPGQPTNIIDNLNNLLATSSGNGEQNMAKFVPNIVVRDYLHAIGSKDRSLLDKATNLLRQGYQNQMRYHQPDGSFGAYQNATGSVFLTAFVAMSIQTASKYISDVDTAMVEKAYDWLASKQHSSGRFDEVGAVIHKDMQGGLRNGISLTSYVLIALLENENAKVKHAVAIQKAMCYLSDSVENIEHPYDLSIATYALMLNGHSKKKRALGKLVGMATPLKKDVTMYFGTENNIETTGYALLSIVMAEYYGNGIPVMRWLVNQRYVTGSFPRTQDTFVGLKALTKLAEKVSPLRHEYIVQLQGRKSISTLKQTTTTGNFHIKPEDIYFQMSRHIPEDTQWLEISVAGIGFGIVQVIYEYSLNLVNFPQRFDLNLEKQNTGSSYELRLKVCASFISRMTNTRSHMALIEVTFPSGYEVDQNPVSEQTTANPIQHIEIRYGGTSVVVYYNNMGTERHCFTVTAYRRGKVAMKRPAYVVAYDYYDRDYNAIAMYEVDD
ncbi:thioester-containing protein 1 allele S3-like [Anopheles moucheti]|uniref:thioester-containing protein 1 allele S3-like n=1 Tax=Anopheles moucheti TaxID=186751 RepID=UPI0022F08747|nr:thioester-containing protein 1 allele S3-like [Anopheles moucheti]